MSYRRRRHNCQQGHLIDNNENVTNISITTIITPIHHVDDNIHHIMLQLPVGLVGVPHSSTQLIFAASISSLLR